MRAIKLTLILLLISACRAQDASAGGNVITVYCNEALGSVNRKIFGNNFIAYDPTTYEEREGPYYGYADYGAGVWDAKRGKGVKEVIGLARSAGIGIIRFPGGCGTHNYDWKETIGSGRKHFLYGLDEFLASCREIGAEAVITVSYFTGTKHDAADLIEYLNSPNDGSNPGGGVAWARIRAKNGHPEAYAVKYFEIGNESYHGNHKDIRKVRPTEYAARYLGYYKEMKKIDPSVKIGPILYKLYWNKRVLGIIKDKMDFAVAHMYSSPRIHKRKLRVMDAHDIYNITLPITILKNETGIKDTLNLIREKAGRDVPLAITEYNGGYRNREPVPYRFCLGTALLNAEFLRMFMNPDNRILMANYWQFCNSYWGMVANGFSGDYQDLGKPYRKRPSYYVYELYHDRFGDILLKSNVECDTYDIRLFKKELKFLRYRGLDNYGPKEYFSVPYLTVNASKSSDGKKVYLMVVNKNIDEEMIFSIELKNFISSSKGQAWILGGPSIDATNEEKPDNVKIAHKRFDIEKNTFVFTFEPHSVTAIEIKRSRNES